MIRHDSTGSGYSRGIMKFTLEKAGDLNVVTSHGPGEVGLGERRYTQSLIVTGTAILADWPVASAESLRASDFGSLLELSPEIIVLGTGARQVFPDPQVFAELAGRGVGFEVMDNGAACRTYNVLLAESRQVALALILP